LLIIFHREFDLFESPSLEKTILQALAMEHKVDPQIHSPQPRSHPSTVVPSHSLVIPSSPSTPIISPWCTLHKINSHSSVEFHAFKNLHSNKDLVAKVTHIDSPDHPEVVSLENPTQVDPSLIPMTANEPDTTNVPLFTHNFYIKHELTTLIMDNGSQKNLIS
jgi:hypothetical protein